jgi:hypothetical protein
MVPPILYEVNEALFLAYFNATNVSYGIVLTIRKIYNMQLIPKVKRKYGITHPRCCSISTNIGKFEFT